MPVDAKAQNRLVAALCLSGAVVGAAIVVAGILWATWVTPERVWTPDQAAEFVAAENAWHAAISGPPGPDGRAVVDTTAVAAAKARFDRIHSELESARFAKNRLGALVAAIGLAIAGAFGVGYLLARGDAS